jgi:predicted peptidase
MSSRLRAITDRSGYDYLLSLPHDYATEPRRLWPLLMFLHGTAPRGTNVWDVTQQGPTRLLAAPPELTPAEIAVGAELSRSFVVVAPQCPHYEVWDDAGVLALLDQVSGELAIDPARVYLTGLSMGGFGAWSVGMRFPERFGALVPVCGGGRVADVAAAARNQRAALERLGVWAFHGARDLVVPLEESERMIDALKLAGVRDVRLTVYPEAEHDAWTATYANAEVYAWLLRHAR